METSRGLLFRVVVGLVLLLILWTAGVNRTVIALLAVVLAVAIAFREWAYPRFEKFLDKKLPGLSKAHPWVRAAIVLVLFVIVYLVLKYLVYGGLAMAGFDVQAMITEGINASIQAK